MPHSHQKKLLRRLSPFELEKEVDRRKSRIHLFQVRDEIIQDAPEIFECEEFKRVKKHPSVSWFIRSFWQWNEYALPIMSSSSHPNFGMQDKLCELAHPFLRGTVVDLGCGAGDFYNRLFKVNGRKIEKIFAVDIDWEALVLMPHKLREVGYRGKVGLIQGSTMSRLPVWNETADCVLSSIGGVTYAGWWFENDRLVCEGREALSKCLKEANRVLKLGGHLAFSSLKPNPNFEMVLADSLIWPVTHLKFDVFWRVARYGFHIKKISQFLHEAEKRQNAHYLSLEEWDSCLKEAGFEVVVSTLGECYAKQGVVVVARKTRNV